MNPNHILDRSFGRPYNADMTANEEWEAANLVYIDLPYPMRLAWDLTKTVKRIRVHRLVAGSFLAAFRDIWQVARWKQKQKYGFDRPTAFYDQATRNFLKDEGLDLFGGVYAFRAMRPSAVTMSHHSYAIAIDIDPGHHAQGDKAATFPGWYVNCWISNGFKWGGDWKGKSRDSMHYEKNKPD